MTANANHSEDDGYKFCPDLVIRRILNTFARDYGMFVRSWHDLPRNDDGQSKRSKAEERVGRACGPKSTQKHSSRETLQSTVPGRSKKIQKLHTISPSPERSNGVDAEPKTATEFR